MGLPNWMLGDSSSTKKEKSSPEKSKNSTGASKNLKNTSTESKEVYQENVDFILGKTPLNVSSLNVSYTHVLSDKEDSEPLQTETKVEPTPLGRSNDNEIPCQASTSFKKSPLKAASSKSPMKAAPSESPLKVAPSSVGGDNDLKEEEPFTYPVLVTTEDLVDSDDEAGKENLDKNLIKKKKTGSQNALTTKKDAGQKKPSCPFGASCYRKNPAHRQEAAHPGDPDYVDPDAEDEHVNEDDERPECEYGMECYRKNPAHRKDFKHTKKPQLKRKAKAKVHKKKEDDEFDDSFIDDDEEEPVDDTDEDEDWHLSSDDD